MTGNFPNPKMHYEKLTIDQAVLFTPNIYQDERGFFTENFSLKKYSEVLGNVPWTHDSLSQSTKNVLRGFHYQKPPHAQAKLVTVLSGEIFDFILDLRASSPTFKKLLRLPLSSQTRQQVFIPVGCAHGFFVRSETVLISYKIAGEYQPEAEDGILITDPDLHLDLPIKFSEAILSQKDLRYKTLSNAPQYF